jgi:hypothetical protein
MPCSPEVLLVVAGDDGCSPSVCANVVCIMGELLSNVGVVNKTNSPNAIIIRFFNLILGICFNDSLIGIYGLENQVIESRRSIMIEGTNKKKGCLRYCQKGQEVLS